MKAHEARVAIDAILAAIDDDDLPTPDKVEQRDDVTIVWFGGLGHHIGSAKRGGIRQPDIYRRDGITDAINGEALTRIDARYLKAVAK